MEQRELWLEKLQGETEIPEIVYQKAQRAFNRIHAEQKPSDTKRKKQKNFLNRRKYAIFILAAVLLIGTLSVSAATYFQWDNKFKEVYKVPPKIEKQLNDSSSAKEINQFTEHDGIRFEAVQSVADTTAAHIVLKIYGSEDFPLRTRMNFRDIEVHMDDMDSLLSIGGGFLEPELSDAQPDDIWHDGLTYDLILMGRTEESLLGKEIRLTFTDIIDSYEEKRTLTELPALLESVWELTIILDNKDNGKEYEGNQPIEGTEAKVKKLRMSPVSFTIDYDWKQQRETNIKRNFEHTVYPPELMGVVLEDGSVLENINHQSNGHFTNEEFTEYQTTGVFSRLIDYEQVKELIFYVEGEIGIESEKIRVPVKN